MGKSKGIIYYNSGTRCLVRLLTSIHSLRKSHPNIDITILAQNDNGYQICNTISNTYNINLKEVDYGVSSGKNKTYIEACLCHTVTPYDLSIWIDSDTIIMKPFAEDLWAFAESSEFAVARFSNWRTTGRSIKKRINSWSEIYPDLMDAAINFGPAVNCGVFSFKKDSLLMKDWCGLALPGRNNFIADEVCCQIILHKYPHIIIDSKYNRSCKYDDPNKEDTRIVHFHGKKHCRINDNRILYNGELWLGEYNEIVKNNIANVLDWQPSGDIMLKKYLKLTISDKK